jgi:hypothetical protein
MVPDSTRSPPAESEDAEAVQQVVTVEAISERALEDTGEVPDQVGDSGSRAPNASEEPQDAGPEPAVRPVGV